MSEFGRGSCWKPTRTTQTWPGRGGAPDSSWLARRSSCLVEARDDQPGRGPTAKETLDVQPPAGLRWICPGCWWACFWAAAGVQKRMHPSSHRSQDHRPDHNRNGEGQQNRAASQQQRRGNPAYTVVRCGLAVGSTEYRTITQHILPAAVRCSMSAGSRWETQIAN